MSSDNDEKKGAHRAKGTDRVLDILECLAMQNRPVGRSELTGLTGMPRSTIYALTDLLLHRNWLEETERGLQLGPQAGFVSNGYLHQNGFERLARDVLAELSARTGTLTEIDVVEDWVHVVALSEGRMAQGYLRPIEGARLPLMPTAAARVILADVPRDVIRRKIADEELVDVSGRRISWEGFFEDVDRGRLQGYVTVTGWLGGTVSTLACPVVDGQGRILASLCMIIPTEEIRRNLHSYLVPLQEAGQKLGNIINRMSWPYADLNWHKLHPARSA
ncbi:hypothetical protein D2T30_07100 [Sinirhodobacter populi]|uniref:IclR family transcriptional regulator n=1 Tax=Paenirhodobacter populi TaxID=2306993 RepID=A0A443JNJ5_9RHOB|nr:helix-turn-helix domain-containing protein [Sinirhodobacter populi]RWR22107.1 hypothetical protein D2T30_07100 [Sinirhodobacter populi]